MVTMTQFDYDQDFYAWTAHNSKLLRNKAFDQIDTNNIAEEIESMGKSARRELINRFAILLAHLLKWQFQAERRSNSWKNTIEEQKDEICELLEDSPSLRHALHEKMARAYHRAILLASTETGFAKEFFPRNCPYTLEQALDNDFLP